MRRAVAENWYTFKKGFKMDNELQKTINEYNGWRNKLTKVIDENFDLLIDMIEGAYGLDCSIVLKEEERNFGNNIILEEIILNKSHLTEDYYLWFFQNNTFYLIERTKKNIILNIKPYIRDDFNFNPNRYTIQKAGVEEEINFLISFMEWTPYFEKKLKGRMQSLNPTDVDKTIKLLGS